jgi:hypothetical protein
MSWLNESGLAQRHVLSANKSKILRKRAKRQPDIPLFYQSISAACECFLRSRGIRTREFKGWQNFRTTHEPNDET